MNQQKLNNYMMQIAELTSTMSKCQRLKVGCVFERDGRPLCTGWNGILEGIDDDCCEEIVGEETCSYCKGVGYFETPGVMSFDCPDCNGTGKLNILKTKDSVIHAEMNALRYMARAGISTLGATLYITHAPCVNCAKHISGLGLSKVIYKNDYRDTDGVNLLKQCNIKIEKMEGKGIV